MAFQLTTEAFLASRETQLEPLIVLEIDGVDLLFGTNPITSAIKYGDANVNYGDPGLFYGGTVTDPNSRDYISLKGTTQEITQQILQEQGGTSSISTFNVSLVDKDGEVSRAIVPDTEFGDILSRNCRVFLSFQGLRFPEDAIQIFQGIVSEARYGQGNVIIKVSHPEDLKRQDIFTKIDTQLDAAITDVETNIPLVSVNGILQSSDTFTSYIRIEDELIQVVDINTGTNTLENAIRGALGTTPVAHADETDLQTFYLVVDNSIDLGLKLMLSGGPQFYFEETAQSFVNINNTTINNSIQFDVPNLIDDFGVAIGDFVTSTGAANAENNFSDRVITGIVSLGTSSYIIVDGDPLVEEAEGAMISIRSRYNTLPDGLGMLPRNVDIERHLEFQDTFTANFPNYLFYLKDTIEGKDFIDKEIYAPAGLYSLPRKGRASVGFTNPPLSTENIPLIDEKNITNLGSLSIERTTSKDFYNAIVYRFNEQLLEDNLLAGEILLSADSTNRIKNIKNRPLKLDSRGLRRNANTLNIIGRLSDRLIDRYKFAAQKVRNVELLYKDGYTIEAGDIVSFGSENMNLRDPDTGEPIVTKLYEVINKKTNIIRGRIRLDLLDTAFDINAKFGVISPSSITRAGSSTNRIFLEKSFGTEPTEAESSKWIQYIDTNITIHNSDYTFSETTTLVGIDPVLPDVLNINPALSIAPGAGLFVEFANYDDSSLDSQAIVKNNFCFINPYTQVTSGASTTEFDVADASEAYIGVTVKVHNDDFTDESPETTIINILGNTITVADDLGFTPTNGDTLEIIGFTDTNPGYRIV